MWVQAPQALDPREEEQTRRFEDLRQFLYVCKNTKTSDERDFICAADTPIKAAGSKKQW